VISVVVPVFRESALIAEVVARISSAVSAVDADYEIILVDDGSDDHTFEEVRRHAVEDAHVRAIRLSRRFGKEAALLAGMSRARGEGVITIDGDLQHPPERIGDFVERWRQGAKIVHGVKHSRPQRGPVYRLASRLFNLCFSKAAGMDILGSSDYKLLDRQIVRLLVNEFPEHSRFLRGLSSWVGFEQAVVMFEVQPRAGGDSRWHLLDLVRYAWNAITSFSSLPLQVVPLLGVVMLVVAAVLSIQTLVSRLTGHAVSGFAQLEITILFTGSLVMIGLGVIGQYLARIYDELKSRPVYIVAEEVGFDRPASHMAPPLPDADSQS